MRIRQTDDLDQIKALDRARFIEGEWSSQADLDTANWWLAEISGRLIGYLGAQRSTVDPRAVYIPKCGVTADARGLGAQLRLIRAAVAWSRTLQDVDRVITYTLTTNWPSSNNFIRAGFVTTGAYSFVGPEVVYWVRLT